MQQLQFLSFSKARPAHGEIRAVVVGFAFHLSCTTCSPREDWKGQGAWADAIIVSCPLQQFLALERMAALLRSSQFGLLKDSHTLLLPCHDKHGLNEQNTQLIVPSSSSCSWTALHACQEGKTVSASKARHCQQVGANARDTAINSEEGPATSPACWTTCAALTR